MPLLLIFSALLSVLTGVIAPGRAVDRQVSSSIVAATGEVASARRPSSQVAAIVLAQAYPTLASVAMAVAPAAISLTIERFADRPRE